MILCQIIWQFPFPSAFQSGSPGSELWDEQWCRCWHPLFPGQLFNLNQTPQCHLNSDFLLWASLWVVVSTFLCNHLLLLVCAPGECALTSNKELWGTRAPARDWYCAEVLNFFGIFSHLKSCSQNVYEEDKAGREWDKARSCYVWHEFPYQIPGALGSRMIPNHVFVICLTGDTIFCSQHPRNMHFCPLVLQDKQT